LRGRSGSFSKSTSDVDLVEEMRRVAFDRIALRDVIFYIMKSVARTQWNAKTETLRGLFETASRQLTSSDEETSGGRRAENISMPRFFLSPSFG